MRIIIIHNEAQYFAGAQKMLGYYLDELTRGNCEVTIAMAENARMRKAIPSSVDVHIIPSNQPFSLRNFGLQLNEVRKCDRKKRCDLLHGWTARDWELTALAGLFLRRPAVGTLHDHPQADFISPRRQKLMACAASRLSSVVCVSNAVRSACEKAGYAFSKLAMIHNGLPSHLPAVRHVHGASIRFGFISIFTERKGLLGLFEIVAELAKKETPAWELWIAGGAQDCVGEELVRKIYARYEKESWWSRVRWIGWVNKPEDFMEAIDVLICPSQQFDPLPTVLLEANRSGIPVVAANVGGVREIVMDGENGWIFEAGDSNRAAEILAGLLDQPSCLKQAGRKGMEIMSKKFNAATMIAEYSNLYSRFADV